MWTILKRDLNAGLKTLHPGREVLFCSKASSNLNEVQFWDDLI